MRIAVMGAGAVGCYYGGMLARAGHAVTLVGRAQHVEAVRRDGLFLDTQSFRQHVAMAASTDASAVRGAELVLFCVKSGDTESAAADIAAHLEPGALVLSLQNGVDNAERLQAALPQHVCPAVVYVATEMAGPGRVKHHGRGELVVGPAAAAPDLVELFAGAEVPVQISDNVAGALWAKLILNCAYNALSAVTQLPYGRLVQGEGVEAVMRDVVDECLRVAQAAGVTVPSDIWEAVQRIARTMPGQLSSTAQDLARGKRSEIDHLNGYVVRKGEALGIATPVNRALHALVKLLEDRSAPPVARAG
jgi:2-dehydropantoate 2-reductase